MNEDPAANIAYPPRPRGAGCFLKGCLTIFIVVMLMGVILGWAGMYIYRGLEPFFSQEPAKVRIYPATDAQYQAVLAKIQPFTQALATGTAATLILTADDLNILIARDPAWDALRGKVYVAIARDQLVADVSVPADTSGRMGTAQIYFGGRITLAASVAGGEFTAVLRRIETLQGKPLPPVLARGVASPGFTENFNDSIMERIRADTRLSGFLGKLRRASIEDNEIVVVSPGGAAPAPAPAPVPTLPPGVTSAAVAGPVGRG